MNLKVEEYLRNYKKQEKEQKEEKDAEYRTQVLIAAGLTEEAECECSEEEYYNTPLQLRKELAEEEDGYHFRILKQMPIEVTDEEFAAIEKTVTTEKMKVSDSQEEQKSGSATFFAVLAWILWVGGLIVSIIVANQEVQHVSTSYYGTTRITTTTEFSFTVFMSTFAIYLISGALCMAVSELFKKLQTIVNLLRRKQ